MCLPSEVQGTTIQRVAATVGAILCLNFGIMFGVSPAHARLYQSAVDTPLNKPIDESAAVWVSSHLFLCAALGALIFGSVSDRIGPKSVLLLSGLLQFTAWFCVHFGFDIIHIYASRMFAGVSAGAAFAVLPTFIREISNFGTTAAVIIEQAQTVGIFIGFLLAEYLPYARVSLVGLGVSFAFSMIFPFVQESPYYYLRKGDTSSLEKSLRWYRGIRNLDDRDRPEFIAELAAFKTQLQATTVGFTSRNRLAKLFALGLALVAGAQLASGFYVLLNNATALLSVAPLRQVSSFGSDAGVLFLAAAPMLGASLAAWLCSRVPRKLLFVVATLVGSASLILAALFLLYHGAWPLLRQPEWRCLPLLLLALHLCCAHLGPLPLATIIIGELLPPKLCSLLSSAIYALTWLLVFLCVHYFAAVQTLLGPAGWLWLFATVGVALALCCWLFVPEMRNKLQADSELSLSDVSMDAAVITKISTISNGHGIA